LKSTGIGAFPKAGWVEGWKRLQCDSIPKMKAQLAQLNSKLSNDTGYLQNVYNFTFDFAKTEGQRSIRESSAYHLSSKSEENH
jgi:DCN1-like protein 1/2